MFKFTKHHMGIITFRTNILNIYYDHIINTLHNYINVFNAIFKDFIVLNVNKTCFLLLKYLITKY